MLSPDYFEYRWSWYRPIIARGDRPTDLCAIDVRRMPIRASGEDAREYLPYALENELLNIFSAAIKHLYDYTERYIIKSIRVSGHQLPTMSPLAREMVQFLRQRYPHIPQNLLHHWSAESNGGLALVETWNKMWHQSWQQDKADTAPWIAAVNILMLRLLREGISSLPHKYGGQTDHIMVCVIGGLYDWALRRFLQDNVEGTVEINRIVAYELMTIPVTPITFLNRQPNVSLLGDDRYVIMAYGLEPELIPRLRKLREKIDLKHEAGMLPLLAKDRMGEHFLKRSWVRLSLWDLAEKTGQGIWMQWVLDAKKLDQLLAKPESLPVGVLKLLQDSKGTLLADWLMMRIAGKKPKTEKPWLADERILNAFRVFEEDVKVECARRIAERVWQDKREKMGKKKRGAESDKALITHWENAELIYFRVDTDLSLHSGASLSTKQACLRVAWSDYLVGIAFAHKEVNVFLEKELMPKFLDLVKKNPQLFLDDISASGCSVRGLVRPLTNFCLELRALLNALFREVSTKFDKAEIHPISMCVTLIGDWNFAMYNRPGDRKYNMAVSPGVVQADAGISHDDGAGQVIAWRDHKAVRKPLGGVRVERLDVGAGQAVSMLYNTGFALTKQVVNELLTSFGNSVYIQEFSLDQEAGLPLFARFRIPTPNLDLIVFSTRAEPKDWTILLKVGRPRLASVDVDLYEWLDESSEAYAEISNHLLTNWPNP
ncbi:MAG: hypothetical protein Q9M22_06750 [Mariprofundaceae bacterium]|nr:hypothetical protein [Mariprofundaceae bacterium]